MYNAYLSNDNVSLNEPTLHDAYETLLTNLESDWDDAADGGADELDVRFAEAHGFLLSAQALGLCPFSVTCNGVTYGVDVS